MGFDQNPDPEERERGEKNAEPYRQKLADVAVAIQRIMGPGTPWVVALVPQGAAGALSASNVSNDDQINLLVAVLGSFGFNDAIPLEQQPYREDTGDIIDITRPKGQA